MRDTINPTTAITSSMSAGHSFGDQTNAKGVYSIRILECEGGAVLHEEEFNNVATFEGLNFMMDSLLSNTSVYVPSYMSLFTAGTPTTASVYATPIVTEATSALIAARLPITWSLSASAVKNTSAAISFTALSAGTFSGGMIVLGANSASVVGNTTGVGNKLLSAGTFTTAQPVIANNVVQISYGLTL